jgi:AcrR family transcriptional regulator
MIMTKPKPTPKAESVAKPRKRERTRDRLLIAAQELLLEHQASTISIRQITERADVVQATFYNYYKTREELIVAVGMLIHTVYSADIEHVIADLEEGDEIFAASIRQTFRYITEGPTYGRLIFDAGLPIDRFLLGMRARFKVDLARGIEQGRFRVTSPELALSMVPGSNLAVALDLYRGDLDPKLIPAVIRRNLEQLGVTARRAEKIANTELELISPQPLPLSWISVRANQ